MHKYIEANSQRNTLNNVNYLITFRYSHPWKSWISIRRWSKSSCYIWHV